LLVLHPGLKFKYFHQQKWEEEWISTVEELVHEEYKNNYEGIVLKDGVPQVSYRYSTHLRCLTLTSQNGNKNDDRGDDSGNDNGDNNDNYAAFGNISVAKAVGSWTNKLDTYLHKPVEHIKDPLRWWMASQHMYLHLYLMAVDFLSIPSLFYLLYS
jgi:hypothetical protein